MRGIERGRERERGRWVKVYPVSLLGPWVVCEGNRERERETSAHKLLVLCVRGILANHLETLISILFTTVSDVIWLSFVSWNVRFLGDLSS